MSHINLPVSRKNDKTMKIFYCVEKLFFGYVCVGSGWLNAVNFGVISSNYLIFGPIY